MDEVLSTLHLPRPRTLFWKTLTTIVVISITFQLFTLIVLAYYLVIPLGQRATDDLAALMVHAAQRWEGLPPDGRRLLVDELNSKHNLIAIEADTPLPDSTSLLPYLYFLERELARHLGGDAVLKMSRDEGDEEWIWADIRASDETLRIGFPQERIGVKPPIALLILLATGFFITFLTTVILVWRQIAPVERLSRAARLIGTGRWPKPLLEEGPEELKLLTRTFNQMSAQVKELLDNRTTLLAGISHDLRTPLTQVQLALAMLPNDGGDPQLMASIRDDLDAINRLIGESLKIGLELSEKSDELVDIGAMLEKITRQAQRKGTEIRLVPGDSCQKRLQPLAFQRIVGNLLENAVHYGDGKPVTVTYRCSDKDLSVQIMDRGSGIPAEQKEAVFNPFYRLEASCIRPHGGSGLGLAIVRQLATSNGWKVQLLDRDGGGTKAVLTIP